MKKFNLVNEQLTEGQKIALAYQGEFGGMTAIQTTYLGCKTAPHYQNCPADMIGVSILHKPRGRRKSWYKTISCNIPLVIYDGWRDIDTDSIVYTPFPCSLEGATARQSKYSMHDVRYFLELLEVMPNGIIFSDIG